MDAFLSTHPDIYAIDSDYDTLKYLYDGRDFAVTNDFMGFKCRFEDVPRDMFKYITIAEIKEELMEIYEDLNERRDRMEVSYV